MTATAFSPAQMEFTRKAHLAAQTQVYPCWYPGGVEFEDVTETVRDLDYAIDCKLAVTLPHPPTRGRHTRPYRAPVRLAVQERYRRVRYMEDYGNQITVTEWNLASGEPSELHKLDAQLLVYGFYDEERDVIVRAGAYSVEAIVHGLAAGTLHAERCNRGDQDFIALDVAELRDAGAWRFKYQEQR